MIHTIENNFLTVEITHKGAEICSIKSKKTNQEFMWDANPDIWGSHAPVLFPIIGMLKDEHYQYKGKTYNIPKHGFIRNNELLKVEQQSQDSITLKYAYDDESLKMYPFKFIFHINFMLVDNTLHVNHKVENIGDEEMLFSLGGHPGFKCPLKENESYTDYYIEFEHEETAPNWTLASNGLLSGKSEPLLSNTSILPLHESLFDNDALILKNLKSRKASLKNKNNNTVLSVSYPDFNYLGIWAKPAAPFVCIEPWLGITDADATDGQFESKEGILKLLPKDSFTANFNISIEEE
ncbi:aldose 1-epimerase family protein [Plebeiibacterium sediminum]|uniref:Aldose 1-epimerase family protein n=1 Tax=Plebeiibacterium sediminum TaxID=2992112 RepID=A0AAE3M1Q1_9BACT|nr:aldose 1-epimerase family protein [Plebeiobacterium sediminum]MCW3785316.1 aldose 1-epimerase family protein [Plebeiobacterium sediminum]